MHPLVVAGVIDGVNKYHFFRSGLFVHLIWEDGVEK
jgi:hypothetical protein